MSTQFFGLSLKEASIMDPHQRLLLETTWEALENAAIPPHTLENTRTGIIFNLLNQINLLFNRRVCWCSTKWVLFIAQRTWN